MIKEVKEYLRSKIKDQFSNCEWKGHGFDIEKMPQDRDLFHIKITDFTPTNQDMYFLTEIPIIVSFTFQQKGRDCDSYDELLERINVLRSNVMIKKSENHPLILRLECNECRVLEDSQNGNNYTIEMSLTAYYKSND